MDSLLARFFATALLATGFACAQPNLLLDADPVNPDLTIHVVVENPTGTTEKWEVRSSGRLIQEEVDGAPIEIRHLAWPANGGMMPRTLHAADLGGDGEPLDVLVLGGAIARGSTIRARPIGLLRVVDCFERDDKILAVPSDAAFAEIDSVAALERAFPGFEETLAHWFENGRADRVVDFQGYASREAATLLIEDAVRAFESALSTGDLPDWKTR